MGADDQRSLRRTLARSHHTGLSDNLVRSVLARDGALFFAAAPALEVVKLTDQVEHFCAYCQ
jgi:hypothetical protein